MTQSPLDKEEQNLNEFFAFYNELKQKSEYRELVQCDTYLFPKDNDLQLSVLRRYLAARNEDLGKAKKMLEECVDLRLQIESKNLYQENGLKVVLEPGAEVYAVDTKLNDKEDKPVLLGRLAVYDGKKVQAENHMRGMCAVFEYMIQKSLPSTKGFTCVIDLETPPKKPESPDGVTILRESLRRANLLFPELLNKLIFINSSRAFRVIWFMVSFVLAKKTRDKIVILGSNYQGKLKEIIGEDNIFPCYGGTGSGPKTLEELDDFVDQFKLSISTQHLG
eukprot:maker-scaffold_5-snap-gene-10.59-mRNA-1 protein AED:0.00 eAED:0.00 QI:150/1/1/1/1/1/2/41/277